MSYRLGSAGAMLVGMLVAGGLCGQAMPAAAPGRVPVRTDLGPGIYVFATPNYGDVGLDGNSVVIVGDDGVLVFDTNGTPAAAEAVLAGIRAVTPKPVRYVVNSHWHWDHWYGNEVYRRAFPDVRIVAHRKTRELMAGPAIAFNKPGLDEQLPGYLAYLEQRLAKATGDEATRLAALLAEDRAFLDQKRAVRPTLPDLTYTDALDIHLGSRLVQVRHAGPAVTPGDSFLYLPAERTLVTGDLLVNPISFALSCYPTNWLKTLEHLGTFDAAVIVPGHGEPLRDRQLLHDTAEVFRVLLREGADARRRGVEVDSARVAILPSLDVLAQRITKGDAARRQAFETQMVDWFLHRVYEELDGPLGDAIAPIPRK